jgi:hypothetical protein
MKKDWHETAAEIGIMAFVGLSLYLAWRIHWILGGVATLFYLYCFIEVCLDKVQK